MSEMAKHGEKWARRMGRSPYPVMTTDDLCKMPVGDLGDKDSFLCLWATWPKMEDALRVMKAWNYELDTRLFTWVKLNPSGRGWHFGCGFHTHANDEVVLLGKRGKGVPRQAKDVFSLVIHPRGKHSSKPAIVRDRIERLYGDVPRIEIFAREVAPGWDRYGNEVICSEGARILEPYLIPPLEVIVDEDEYQGLPVEDTQQESWDYGEQIRLI